ncbi:hypothetical protein Nepgr_025361 [Nepenthes gracilis]|uniref:Uncharacterized protein n=1 Tax=Nepenthes gracilis TaxID=150966 RepID=A0AAD3XZL4_NEPGR|nr:hypothetical protein Nepgr_025361 [Nepenthes gracilis]
MEHKAMSPATQPHPRRRSHWCTEAIEQHGEMMIEWTDTKIIGHRVPKIRTRTWRSELQSTAGSRDHLCFNPRASSPLQGSPTEE